MGHFLDDLGGKFDEWIDETIFFDTSKYSVKQVFFEQAKKHYKKPGVDSGACGFGAHFGKI